MADNNAITAAAIEFIETVGYEDLPSEALRVGKRCMVDTLGVVFSHGIHVNTRANSSYRILEV